MMSSSGSSAASQIDVNEEKELALNYGTVRLSENARGASSILGHEEELEVDLMAWTTWGLRVAYLSLFLMAFTTSLEGQVTYSLTAFATSSFKTHSLISTVYVVQGIINAVIKPPMAKIANVFGRLEAFSLSVLFCALGYIQQSLSQNVETFAAAQIFYSAGLTGLQILQQIFIADTSSLLNRALLSSLPDLPFLVTVWIGPVIGAAILSSASWRLGYGMWALILPLTFVPLALSLFLNGRRNKRAAGSEPRPEERTSRGRKMRKLMKDLDVVGILILSVALVLILVPLTLASRISGGWRNGGVIGMLILGFVFLLGFPAWELNPKLAPHPLVPLDLLRSRTFCACCGIGFLYFMIFYMSVQPYFYSYLLVVQNRSVAAAGHITQTFSFTSAIAAVLVSLLIKRARRYKAFVVAGSLAYASGVALMLRYRVPAASTGALVGSQLVLGAGCSLVHVPAQLGVQASSPARRHVAAATAVFLTAVEIGGAAGSALSGALWGRLVPAKLALYLPEGARADAPAIYASVVVARSYAMGSPERVAIVRAYQETMTSLLAVALAFCVPLVLLSLMLRDFRLDGAEGNGKGRADEGEAAGLGREVDDVQDSAVPLLGDSAR